MGLAAAQECANAIEIAYDQGSGGEFVPGSSNYDSCCRYLRDLCRVTGMNYLYVYKYDTENNTITYIMAVGASDDENEMINRERPYGKVVHTKISDAEIRSLAGEDVKSPIETNDQLGFMFDWVSPVRGMGNDVLAGASYSVTKQRQEEMANVWNSLLPFAIVFLVLFIVEILILRKSVFDPLTVIAQRMRGFRANRMDELEPLGITSNDEIGDLAISFNNMAVSLDKYIKDLTAVTAEKERIGAELDVAKHIQSSMLPCIFPPYPDRKEFEIYATMQPAKEVGGDFYDFFMVDDEHLAIVMADVSGKGVPAALFMVIGKTLIKDHTTSSSDLGDVFSEVNNMLCESNSEGLFITAFEGVLNLRTGEFRYVNAGHEPPFIAHAGGRFAAQKIRPGFVLAGMEDIRYKSGSIQIEPGDKIFQYTDGVTEATDADNKLYGMERLENVLNANLDQSPNDILPAIKKDIDQFVGNAPQFDDITMLCLEYKERMK